MPHNAVALDGSWRSPESIGRDEAATITLDRPGVYRGSDRNRVVVEHSVGRLNRFHRVATRYHKRAWNYLARVTLAATIIWLWSFADALVAGVEAIPCPGGNQGQDEGSEGDDHEPG